MERSVPVGQPYTEYSYSSTHYSQQPVAQPIVAPGGYGTQGSYHNPYPESLPAAYYQQQPQYYAPRETSVFYEALPYGVGTLSAGIVGAVIAFSAASTVLAVMGVAIALMGAYTFLGVVGCAIATSGNPSKFREIVWGSMTTMAGVAISEILTTVAKAVLIDLIFNRKRDH